MKLFIFSGLPGTGKSALIEKAKKYYFAWDEERLVLEFTNPFHENYLKANLL